MTAIQIGRNEYGENRNLGLKHSGDADTELVKALQKMKRPYVNTQFDRPQAFAGPVAPKVMQLPRRNLVH